MQKKHVKNKEYILCNPKVRKVNAPSNPQLLRIIWREEFLQVDFGYPTSSIYINGGWVNFGAKAYLEDISNGRQYTLIDSINIVLSPQKHEFDYNKERLFFSIRFDPIPLKSAVFNLFESDSRTVNDFYYLGVEFNVDQLVEML